MQFKFSSPHVEQFVAEQVRSGRFASADALLEEAVGRMMIEESGDLTDEDRQAIVEADAEIDRGEFVDFDTFAAETRRLHGVE